MRHDTETAGSPRNDDPRAVREHLVPSAPLALHTSSSSNHPAPHWLLQGHGQRQDTCRAKTFSPGRHTHALSASPHSAFQQATRHSLWLAPPLYHHPPQSSFPSAPPTLPSSLPPPIPNFSRLHRMCITSFLAVWSRITPLRFTHRPAGGEQAALALHKLALTSHRATASSTTPTTSLHIPAFSKALGPLPAPRRHTDCQHRAFDATQARSLARL